MNSRKKSAKNSSFSQGSVKIGLTGVGFLLAVLIIFGGAFYLYQVNNLATKGYEIGALEHNIQELKKNNEKYKIQEVELKSMYNIEKTTEELDLVGSSDITYLEINGPVAMK